MNDQLAKRETNPVRTRVHRYADYYRAARADRVLPVVGFHCHLILPDIDRDRIRVTRYVIPPGKEGRPDKISYDVYGNRFSGDLLVTFNDITDPFTDLRVGTLLLIPNLKDLEREFKRAQDVK